MRRNKDGTLDKRFKQNKTPKDKLSEPVVQETQEIQVDEQIFYNQFAIDPQVLFNDLLEANNLKLDFDVLEGTVPTKYGIIKLTEPTLVIKASYVTAK